MPSHDPNHPLSKGHVLWPNQPGTTQALQDKAVRKDKTEPFSRSRVEGKLHQTGYWAACTDTDRSPAGGTRGGTTSRTFKSARECLSDLRSFKIKVFRPTVRSSAISLLSLCKRKFLYRYRLGLKPKTYSSAPTIGQLYHEIMAQLYSGQTMGQALGHVADNALDIEKDLTEKAGELGVLPGGLTLRQALDKLYSDVQLAKVMAMWVWKNFPVNFDHWEIMFTPETLVQLKYETINQPIRCRIDALLRKKDTNEVWIVDHKTTGMASPTDRAQLVLMEVQPKLYRLAVCGLLKDYNKEHNTELKCVGMIHNFIKKPTIRFSPDSKDKLTLEYPKAIAEKLVQGMPLTPTQQETRTLYDTRIAKDKKLGTPWDKYLTRIDEWYTTQQEQHPEDPPYLRSKIRWVEPEMTTELLVVVREASWASRAFPDFSKFYRDPSGDACFHYNTRCPYWDLCTNKVSNWKRIIETDFEVISRDDEDTQRHNN